MFYFIRREEPPQTFTSGTDPDTHSSDTDLQLCRHLASKIEKH